MMDDVSREGADGMDGRERAARARGQGTACRAQRAQRGAGCRGGGRWPGPVGKELQCVTQRLAGEDPLCDAIMRAVRDGLVWVGGCDETEESKMESSHMQLQDTEGVRARMNPATCHPQRARSRARARQSRVLSRRFTAVDARLLELATLHWAKWCNSPGGMIGPACNLPGKAALLYPSLRDTGA